MFKLLVLLCVTIFLPWDIFSDVNEFVQQYNLVNVHFSKFYTCNILFILTCLRNTKVFWIACLCVMQEMLFAKKLSHIIPKIILKIPKVMDGPKQLHLQQHKEISRSDEIDLMTRWY